MKLIINSIALLCFIAMTPAPASAQSTAPSLTERCNAGDSYACERYAWDMGSAGSWLVASQYARKGCNLGRATSCTAAGIYEKNYRNHGDQSAINNRRQESINRGQQTGDWISGIRYHLKRDRHIGTMATLIQGGGPQMMRSLMFDELEDLTYWNWNADEAGAKRLVQAEWSRRGGAMTVENRRLEQEARQSGANAATSYDSNSRSGYTPRNSSSPSSYRPKPAADAYTCTHHGGTGGGSVCKPAY